MVEIVNVGAPVGPAETIFTSVAAPPEPFTGIYVVIKTLVISYGPIDNISTGIPAASTIAVGV